MPFSAQVHMEDILDLARSRDIETALSLWTLLASTSRLPEMGGLIDALEGVIPSNYLACRETATGFHIERAGEALAKTAGGSLFHAPPGAFSESMRPFITDVFGEALRHRQPVYAEHYDNGSALIHRWELLAMPVMSEDGPGIVSLNLPLAYHQDVLMAIIGANPFAIFAARAVKDDDGQIADFKVNLVNDAGCGLLDERREGILFRPLSEVMPDFFKSGALARLVKTATDGVADTFTFERKTGATTPAGSPQSFRVTVVRQDDTVVMTFADITELSQAKARLTRQHDKLLKTNEDLRRQKEDLAATAESLELARVALGAEIKRRAELEQRLRQLAATDPLTGIANRRSLFDAAGHEMQRARRYRAAFSVIMVDIDHFKAINDTFGHAGGDKVLSDFAHLCVDIGRLDLDIVGRIGGEEFAILMPGTDIKGALDFAERLRQAIASASFSVDGGTVPVTASFGVATCRESDGEVADLFRRADEALYRAKAAGRNTVIEQAA